MAPRNTATFVAEIFNTKISIIIPIFNAENYLPKCLVSVLRQSHKNIEVILVNDGSTDGSLLVCQ